MKFWFPTLEGFEFWTLEHFELFCVPGGGTALMYWVVVVMLDLLDVVMNVSKQQINMKLERFCNN